MVKSVLVIVSHPKDRKQGDALTPLLFVLALYAIIEV
jgi:hypothetical protein